MPRSRAAAASSYVHYKHSETIVAMGMEVAVERASGRIRVERVEAEPDHKNRCNDRDRVEEPNHVCPRRRAKRPSHTCSAPFTPVAIRSTNNMSAYILRFSKLS